ncbi:SDR family oxidoreductase [Chitinophaga sp. 30R24]|uniref:SDR family oxidoreductase n=1 Tax=Chitinophaga sp. 30R24 TaxID=3248838 RepID=UPI003B8F551E
MATNNANKQLVLVTGGSGFVGSHCILQLLHAGYRVRTSVRSLKREAAVRAMLRAAGTEAGNNLSFVAADLLSDTGWAAAVDQCNFVLHVASPFPTDAPKHEEELINPAREGTLRVLRAARQAGAKRVVMTSSFAAIGYGAIPTGRPFNEQDWTDPTSKNISAYVKSKTLAERAAWDFIAQEGDGLELSVVNPVGIFGPILGADYSASIQLVRNMLTGSMPACPQLSFGVVDVRDVASLHLLAMTHSAANGERLLAITGDCITMHDLAMILKTGMGTAASHVPTKVLPNWLVRASSLFKPALKGIVPELGKIKHASNEKAQHLLGWIPRSKEDAIISTAESLMQFGLLKGAGSSL